MFIRMRYSVFFLMVPLVGEYGFIQHTDATKPQPHNDVSCSYVFLFLITRRRKMLVQKLASSESGLARQISLAHVNALRKRVSGRRQRSPNQQNHRQHRQQQQQHSTVMHDWKFSLPPNHFLSTLSTFPGKSVALARRTL